MGQGIIGYDMMYGYNWIFMLFGILLIVGIVLLAVWLFRQSGTGPGHGREETPLEILKKRYAKGEIDKEEFEQKKRDLM
jgi:putative membrane protein